MSLFALSISHRTAGISTLAAASLADDAAIKLCHTLALGDHVSEVAVLSTCNRTEVYAEVDRFHAGLDEVVDELARLTGVGQATLQSSCAVFYDEGVVGHAFAVASGLDSMVVGESQILGQFRTALALGQQAGTVGTALNALFQQGIRVGKRVHTETEVGRAGRSVADAAFDAVRQQDGGLAGRRVLVAGAGQMASLAARTAVADGAHVTLVNRTDATAVALAESLNTVAEAGRTVSARPWAELARVVAEQDVVVSCTASTGYLLGPDELAGTSVRTVVDLAMPPDVDPAVADLPGLALVNLASLADSGATDTDRADLAAATALVNDEVSGFLAGRHARAVTPTVVALRSMADQVVDAELARLTKRVELDEATSDEVRRTVNRVAQKLLHAPTVRVQEYAADDELDYAAALRALFALDPQTVAAVTSSEVRR
ncbi:glutamyl-tRNA reductase [Propionibacteriaceae bacterium Y2011]|uniref:glutamyl-tRNA reductase n=1 Tax=Microlunatus sp. Y2014 TaxID=3418488 RepID=UPI003B469540